MDSGAAQTVLMYFVLPVWLAAGFADYLCHRAAPSRREAAGRNHFCICSNLAKWPASRSAFRSVSCGAVLG
jgi:hypothetical protein